MVLILSQGLVFAESGAFVSVGCLDVIGCFIATYQHSVVEAAVQTKGIVGCFSRPRVHFCLLPEEKSEASSHY